jgi:tRNA threonylcarbamoyladenosine biosynthesis protein TsaB
VSKGNDVLAYQHSEEKSKQAEILVPTIEMLLDRLSLSYQDIDAIATTIGPGSFTGIRIGLSVANALAMSTDIPLFGISTLGGFAIQAGTENSNAKPVIALQKAGKGQAFVQTFAADTLVPMNDINLIDEKDIVTLNGTKNLITGNIEASDILFHLIPQLDARYIAQAALQLKPEPQKQLSPLYIRPPDATLPNQTFSDQVGNE